MQLIEEKLSYPSFWPSPLDHNTARRYSPCSPGTEVGEVIVLTHDLIGSLLSYCDNVTLRIFWVASKSTSVLVLQTLSMRLGVCYERVRVVCSLSFLQIRMLVIINMFMAKHKEMCNHMC